ncbi:leucyl/phenylalanyl-tRNA--protein transferase [Algimonas arctica]|uniref:Leucyl/phenylalanyl-tRNA--protein transferase n=1 Tax=Algimonas arctica TaxID=1479486 RepID=A0A8J3G381_9PROT|nr:leucyl/phenylalanyl-tRNA--protein transferase [Algimonas arctica]GHB03137.1 leucyl/phenylalanyl-tRNA--protein transferase [Algimonas arctica]
MSSFGPEDLIACYRRGVFPMADSRDAEGLYVMEPDTRAVFPIETFSPSRSMQKFARKTPLKVTINNAFSHIITACADLREETWISYGIEWLYGILNERGEAHSVEVWDGEILVGGLYGVTQGGAFFGESMFSTQTNASKLALIHLIDRLRARGFTLLDAQFMTDHLATLGAIEITKAQYKKCLESALLIDTSFD